MKILTATQMRRVEEECTKLGILTSTLMENAGREFATQMRRILGSVKDKTILFLIGPGNNGGDGLVAARYVHRWGAKVSLCLFGNRALDDPLMAFAAEQSVSVTLTNKDKNLKKLEELLSEADAVVDAVFGTGMNRPLTGVYSEALNRLNQSKKANPSLTVIALDLPSGLNADSGACDPACPFADETITLGFPKPGLFNLPAAERVGRITIVDIGIPSHLVNEITDEYLEREEIKSLLPKRPSFANKGYFGRVLVVAGSERYLGAPYLACSAAMRSGAGLVTLAIAKSLHPILASKLTEVTFLPLPESKTGLIPDNALDIILEEIKRYDALLVGCGLGQAKEAWDFLKGLIPILNNSDKKIVLDADALNFLAEVPEWWQRLSIDAILTPHPGEMARLTGLTADGVQQDRINLSRKMAARWHKTVILKGAYTVIASPEGRIRVSPFANPGLASAGTGDVLAGVVSGMLAQGLELFDAATLGVYLHGEAGEMVRENIGNTGMIASDLLPVLPLVIKKLRGD